MKESECTYQLTNYYVALDDIMFAIDQLKKYRALYITKRNNAGEFAVYTPPPEFSYSNKNQPFISRFAENAPNEDK